MKFTKVFKVGELGEGGIKKVEVAGQAVDVALVKGKYYAFSDVCSHEECSLSEGFLEDQNVVCPCHGSKFNMESGAAKSLPAVLPIKTYPVKVEGNNIYVQV